ncbi:hypothetical protein PM082_004561 [Marasmius tenuissimus]|nr:hypothetical protein PM082_004561 [Marasmius tenuissimus]
MFLRISATDGDQNGGSQSLVESFSKDPALVDDPALLEVLRRPLAIRHPGLSENKRYRLARIQEPRWVDHEFVTNLVWRCGAMWVRDRCKIYVPTPPKT